MFRNKRGSETKRPKNTTSKHNEKVEKMKALSVREPYATYIAKGIKIVENRSWKPPAKLINTPIALHRCACREPAIIGIFKIIDILKPQEALQKFPSQKEHINNWDGVYCLVVEMIKTCEPIPIKGQLRFWNVPEEIVRKLLT